MKSDGLPAAERERYRENGFLVVEGLVSGAEVEEIRSEAARICRGFYPVKGIEPVPGSASDEEALARYLCIHQPHKVSPVIRRYAEHPGVADVLSRLIGPNVKCMQTMLFIKPPQFPGQ